MGMTSMTDAFDATLTPEERAAATFTEWSDETLARGVRALAAELHDALGFDGITGMAAVLALEKILRNSDVDRYEVRLDGGAIITVRLPLMKRGDPGLTPARDQTTLVSQPSTLNLQPSTLP